MLAEILFEFLAQLLIEGLIEGILHLSKAGVRVAAGRTSSARAIRAATFTLLGAVNGLLSLWLLPQALFPAASVTGISLVAAPLATGFVMWRLGQARPDWVPGPDSLLHFWTAFDFAFGMAVVRLAHAVGWIA